MAEPNAVQKPAGTISRLCANSFCESSIDNSLFILKAGPGTVAFYYCDFCGIDICGRCVWRATKDALHDVLPKTVIARVMQERQKLLAARASGKAGFVLGKNDLQVEQIPCCPYCGLPMTVDRNEI